jgi:hypothetical protein
METLLFEANLEIDSVGLEQRGAALLSAVPHAAEVFRPDLTPQTILKDETVKVMLRDNRLGLLEEALAVARIQDTDQVYAVLKLRCVAQAHPECRFRWVRLALNFGDDSDVTIRGMEPREVKYEQALKITTKTSGSVGLEATELKIGPKASAEVTKEYQIYVPEITSTGIGFSAAYWNFQALGESDLFVDSDLQLMITYPVSIADVNAAFTLRAGVGLKGWIGSIPLVTKRTVAFTGLVPLPPA